MGRADSAAARIGYLPEKGPLYPDMTPLQLLRLFGEARGLSKPRLADRIGGVVEQCGLMMENGSLEPPFYRLTDDAPAG